MAKRGEHLRRKSPIGASVDFASLAKIAMFEGPMSDPVAKAFELARSGDYADLHDIEVQLKREGYSGILMHLNSPSLRKQLRGIVKEAYTAKSGNGEPGVDD